MSRELHPHHRQGRFHGANSGAASVSSKSCDQPYAKVLDAPMVDLNPVSDDEYPKKFLVTVPKGGNSKTGLVLTAPWGQEVHLRMPDGVLLKEGDQIKITVPDPASGEAPRAEAVVDWAMKPENQLALPPKTKETKPDSVEKHAVPTSRPPAQPSSASKPSIPDELIEMLQKRQNEDDALHGRESQLCIMTPSGVQRCFDFTGLTPEQKQKAAAEAVRLVGQSCAPEGMVMEDVEFQNMDLKDGATYSEKVEEARRAFKDTKMDGPSDSSGKSPEKTTALQAVMRQAILAREKSHAAEMKAEFLKQVNFFWELVCRQNHIKLSSELALAAKRHVHDQLTDGTLTPDNVDDEFSRLNACVKHGWPISTPSCDFDKLFQERADAFANQLIEEEDAEKAAKEAQKSQLSKKAAKKKRQAERAHAAAADALKPIQEDKVELDDPPVDTPVETGPNRDQVGKYIQHRMEAVGVSSSSVVKPPVTKPTKKRDEKFFIRAEKFVNLSDIGAALAKKKEDAATSVATALQCVVCMKNERSMAIVPCGHKCLCEDCGKRSVIRDNKCPMCRAEIQMFMRVWE